MVYIYLYECSIILFYFHYNSYDDMCSMFIVPHQLDNILLFFHSGYNANAILTILTLYYQTFATPDWVH